jgi:poly(3-hydroxybutyrate) depolymerase
MESTPLLETTEPISVFQINGAADSIIPIDGGAKLGHVFLDALESAKIWASHFNCDSKPLTESIGEDTQYVFSNCNGENEVRYLRVENGEHNIHWQDPQIFNKVWAFFKRF